MSRGLGKLQRWIVVHAYRKAVLREVPEGWRFPRKYFDLFRGGSHPLTKEDQERLDWGHDRAKLPLLLYPEFDYCTGGEKDSARKLLLKSEIMLNYFEGLKLSRKVSDIGSSLGEKFRATPAYRSALASYGRARRSLLERRLVREWWSGFSVNAWSGFDLTEGGKWQAKNLLSVNTGQRPRTVNA